MEQKLMNISLTIEQAQFVFGTLVHTPLPFMQVQPVIEAFQLAAEQEQLKARNTASPQADVAPKDDVSVKTET